MDIYRFIDSKDIRAYLKSLRCDSTLTEAAFLVWQCAMQRSPKNTKGGGL